MDWLYIVFAVIVFVIGGLTAYFKTKSSITDMVSFLIAQAEDTALSGSEKMQQVVSILYSKVPPVFRSVLTTDVLEEIAQRIFDYTKKYAVAWAEKQDNDKKET